MLVLGHRGTITDNGISQNSLRAFEEAVECADGFETDACVTKDGEIFLIHEAKYADDAKGAEYCVTEHLDAASAAYIGTRRIDQLVEEEIRTLRLKDGQGIPTLQEALKLVGAHKGKIIDIELKAWNVVGPVLALVQKNIADKIITANQIIISSFNFPTLAIAREKAPELKIGAIFIGAGQKKTPLFPWHPESDACYTPLVQEELSDPLLKQVHPNYFVMPESMLTESTAAFVATDYPDTLLAGWVYAERGDFDLPDLLKRLKQLEHTGKIAAIMPDNPHVFKEAWKK